jgi:hypothetical protein
MELKKDNNTSLPPTHWLASPPPPIIQITYNNLRVDNNSHPSLDIS